MSELITYLNNTPYVNNDYEVHGEYVLFDDEKYYRISNFNKMTPFFMSLVSHSDHWLFISSNGGLTAGRGNDNMALFPYYTDDKIIDNAENTGSKTIIRVQKNNKSFLWEPFSDSWKGVYTINRNIYKNQVGNKVVFEEINNDLQLLFRYKWQFSDVYGFVKTAELVEIGDSNVIVDILDGIQNILPSGVSASLQHNTSNLVNAYKRNELVSVARLGIFSLSAMIVDKAEPSEALRATTVWSSGLKPTKILLSSKQLDSFRKNEPLKTETDLRAERGSYFIKGRVNLKKKQGWRWYIVADVNQDHSDVYSLIDFLKNDPVQISTQLNEDISTGTKSLQTLVGKSDGIQLTNDELSVGRHFSNVLFNIMRGGVFESGYTIEKSDLREYVKSANKYVASKHSDFLDKLPDGILAVDLFQQLSACKDSDFVRICFEYLPLTFSRRHGDPSRPWNKFTVPGKNSDGSYVKSYEGNWRDIFQNWEALAHSFPAYILSMVSRFVNASTIDGYNPYRITRDGIDWEVVDPDDPWSFIGYWGDHQIIYLLKLLELANDYQSESFKEMLEKPVFVYANVPYRIKPYREIVKNPYDTIEFEVDKEKEILQRSAELGADGKLVWSGKNQLVRASLMEKILLPFLVKFSNFVPEAGIWLNTQRPEWNDANNALVGNGTSMVTLYYMRRYVSFLQDLTNQQPKLNISLNKPVSEFLKGLTNKLKDNRSFLSKSITNKQRKKIVDDLGFLGEKYRDKAYKGFNNKTNSVSVSQLKTFLLLSLEYIDHSIRANKRKDGLYNAYNLIEFTNDSLTITPLYEMLEGQVSVLSSGLLSPNEALDVMNALKKSKIYREDQYSYMLYPNRELPRFLSKNLIPLKFIEKSKLAQLLIEKGDESILKKDINGNYHFNGSFRNAENLKEALNSLLNTDYKKYAEREYESFLDIFEQLFNHKAFTGRSGTFFGYEGLGSIYWHMVSKLLLTVQENIYWARNKNADNKVVGKMIDHYYEIRAGIGINKTPDLYGAFPTDPYSHTPGNKGAQQPGMTGQVKEDVINRMAELGTIVRKGILSFDPAFLNPGEFLTTDKKFEYINVKGDYENVELLKSQLGFTFCQVPVVYVKSKTDEIHLEFEDGKTDTINGRSLPRKYSDEIFNRTGYIRLLKVFLSE